MTEKDYTPSDLNLINTVFKGNADRFEEALEAAGHETLYWKHIELTCKVLPELEKNAAALIERRLGYLPIKSVYLPFETFLRTLIAQFHRNEITDERFTAKAEQAITLIRNEDIRRGGWMRKIEFDDKDYDSYENFMPAYKINARNRIVKLLGYEPELRYSLHAETFMRKFLQFDTHWNECWYEFDFKCITLLRYREYYLTQGKEAAEKSPLLGFYPAINR
ncbi:MAG TPA: hypothetical protein PLN13_03505 [Bacteroidia bacterium]|nr:hypothetical protein [Bacteroidia bacterium]HRH07621.1 hypothetical protein [Bacteroidia bacterium]